MSEDATWVIKCGSLEGTIVAPSAEVAFVKLVADYDGDLARIFRASTTGNKRGRYYYTENVLREAGLWATEDNQ